MFENSRAIVFDLDGTLVNTIPLIFACYDHTLEAHLPGFKPPREVIISNLGRSLEAILHDYAVASGSERPGHIAASMASTYREFQRLNLDRLIRSYDGVPEMLDALRSMGYVLGLATSKVEWAARLTYEYYGLGKFLDVLVFHDETRLHKPHPEPLLLAARKSGHPPEEVVYVGDSVHDMVAGKTAGMLTIGAAWGPFEPALLRSAGADALAYRPGDLVALLPGPRARVGMNSTGDE